MKDNKQNRQADSEESDSEPEDDTQKAFVSSVTSLLVVLVAAIVMLLNINVLLLLILWLIALVFMVAAFKKAAGNKSDIALKSLRLCKITLAAIVAIPVTLLIINVSSQPTSVSEEQFNSVQERASKKEVLNILGKPLIQKQFNDIRSDPSVRPLSHSCLTYRAKDESKTYYTFCFKRYKNDDEEILYDRIKVDGRPGN